MTHSCRRVIRLHTAHVTAAADDLVTARERAGSRFVLVAHEKLVSSRDQLCQSTCTCT